MVKEGSIRKDSIKEDLMALSARGGLARLSNFERELLKYEVPKILRR
jgi:hypothetical protein